MDARPWVRSVRPEARARLFCFGYAGGGTAEFRAWADGLSPAIDLCPVVLPGRENRISERAFDDLPALIEALVPALAPVAALAPFAVYGHSLGSWVAFEWVRALRRLRKALPVQLMVAARRAPHRPGRLPALSPLPDDAFVEAVQQRYGGIPGAIRSDPELMRLFLPPLRADFTLLDRYRYRDEPPLPVPLTVFHGTDDPNDEVADIRAWSEHTSAGCVVVPLPFGHFFVRDAADDITDRVNAALRPAISA